MCSVTVTLGVTVTLVVPDLPDGVVRAGDALRRAVAAALASKAKRMQAERKLAEEMAAEADRLHRRLTEEANERTAMAEREAQLQRRLDAATAERDRLALQVDDLIGQ